VWSYVKCRILQPKINGLKISVKKFASVEDFWLLLKRLRKMNYLYSFRCELNLIVLKMDISSADWSFVYL